MFIARASVGKLPRHEITGGEGDHAGQHDAEGEAGEVGTQQDGDRGGDDHADDGHVGQTLPAGHEHLDQLGDGEDAHHDADAEGQQDADVVQQRGEIAGGQRADGGRQGLGDDGLIIAQQLQNHGAGHAGDDHGGGGDAAQQEQLDDLKEAQLDDGGVFLLENLQQHDDGKEDDKQHRADGAGLFAFDLLEDGRQTAEDQADEQRVGGQRELGERPLERKAQRGDGCHHAHGIGENEADGLLEFLEQVRHAVDQLVVDAHGHHHRAAGHAGDDVGQADDHALENSNNQFHVHKLLAGLLGSGFAARQS